MHNIVAAAAGAIAVLLLAGCSVFGVPTTEHAASSLPEDDETVTTTAGPSPATSVTPSDPVDERSPTPQPPSKHDQSTVVRYIWPDASWTISAGPEASRMCQEPEAASSFTDRNGYFSCGPTAASLLACQSRGSGALCIQNADDRKAVLISGPGVAGYAGRSIAGPIPFRARLKSGTTCSVASHDHGTHWRDRFSWYRCGDGSELLTRENIEDTFDDDEATWTVQRSRDRQAPEKDTVVWVEYAGNPEDH